jgi:RNA polymerase sigma-70 factor (ECF subfamily)
VVQDAMWRLARRYGDRDPAEWAPLFHTILQRRIRDSLRRSRVRSRFRAWLGGGGGDGDGDGGVDPIASLPDRRGPDPAEQVAQGRATEVLEAALRALPPRQQQAFLLRAWEGLDVRETARAMGCSQGSVKTHYARALGALRAKLEGHWP